MLSVNEALSHLEASLRQESFDAKRPDVGVAWSAFRAFGAMPVEVAEDAFLFECGVYDDRDGAPRFMWSLKRQFTHESDSENPTMEHLHLTFYFPVQDGDVERDAIEWSHDHASLAEFWAHLESLPQFKEGLTRSSPVGFEVFQEEV